ncbi:hypothetical protein OAC16_03625 [Flavobacteriaceae bacterium]|nr:hypothetical protein [Flavobacteriaceae bacterium]
MQSPFQKYKALILMLFLGGFISFVDSFILDGQFKGIEEHKHLIYLGTLVAGLAVVLAIVIKEDNPTD